MSLNDIESSSNAANALEGIDSVIPDITGFPA
jgi:hypothetical protein